MESAPPEKRVALFMPGLPEKLLFVIFCNESTRCLDNSDITKKNIRSGYMHLRIFEICIIIFTSNPSKLNRRNYYGTDQMSRMRY